MGRTIVMAACAGVVLFACVPPPGTPLPDPVTVGYPGAAMVPAEGAIVTFTGPCVKQSIPGTFRTPIVIPHGSAVTKVSFSYITAVGLGTTKFTMFLSKLDGSADTAITPVTGSTGPGDLTLVVTLTPAKTVGDGEGVYVLAELDATSSVCGVEVTYQPAA